MCTAVAIPCSDLPQALFEAHDLTRRVHDRGNNRPEVRFDCMDPEPLLPVAIRGTIELVQWGEPGPVGAAADDTLDVEGVRRGRGMGRHRRGHRAVRHRHPVRV